LLKFRSTNPITLLLRIRAFEVSEPVITPVNSTLIIIKKIKSTDTFIFYKVNVNFFEFNQSIFRPRILIESKLVRIRA
jgi:hypothetical protein